VDYSQHNQIVSFIWGIADDVLRDLYVRGKYRDVILPMTVFRRFDAVLEPTKQAVFDMKENLDKAGIIQQDQALRQAAGRRFSTLRSSRCGISRRGRVSSSFGPTSRRILMAFHQTSRTSLKTSSSAIRSPGCRKPTPSARSSRS
jgi:type I restriction-modification system DNA methylase subunit